jgi:hypothetical protein
MEFEAEEVATKGTKITKEKSAAFPLGILFVSFVLFVANPYC